MFVLKLVFLALLALSAAQQDIPRYIQGQWIIPDEIPQYEDPEQSLAVEERIWPQSPDVVELVTPEDQNLLTTPEPHAMEAYARKEQDSDEGGESAVWKICLVVSVLLVSLVGSLSMTYYMCVWRGGRIHYKPQREDNA
ncbi:hypothetical protein EPR50_G00169360 [Perca flavescens]|uniref:Uncharacterized protein n=1 Tax=Perca flavescens TaxID=8167 RepID=A0A484CE09_PERFV|nr:uncharacterized protein LOC114571161 isoform X1 [Perca flavescens]TDH02102.1 hypothetical protein EPR50_G00169360 [Perca flavescens]